MVYDSVVRYTSTCTTVGQTPGVGGIPRKAMDREDGAPPTGGPCFVFTRYKFNPLSK